MERGGGRKGKRERDESEYFTHNNMWTSTGTSH